MCSALRCTTLYEGSCCSACLVRQNTCTHVISDTRIHNSSNWLFLSYEEKHWYLHQNFVLQWALSAIAMELYHGQSTFNPSALKRASCLICGATQGNKAALAENLTQAFCQRPWHGKKRDFFFSISYRSWKGQRREISMLADVEYL